ncbi:MAG: alkaline phosphatase [Capnocytophaga sp.]|nr:alkaline phosphatase [Capnocytophaga sp.]
MKKILSTACVVLLASCNSNEQTSADCLKLPELQTFTNKNPHEVRTVVFDNDPSEVKNVILLIGDGMGQTVVSSAWVANGRQLYMTNAPVQGISVTTAHDNIITDSAAGATAMATGQKTNVGYVGVTPQGEPLPTLNELAKKAGKSTGIISTCRIVDATPSAFAIKNTDRDASEDIALSYLDTEIDFILGGGQNFFNKRKDGQNLLPKITENGFQLLTDTLVSSLHSDKVFALVAPHDMPKASERGDLLATSALKALEILSKNENGFFLMVESAMIDDYGHWNEFGNMMEETLDFDRSIGRIAEWAAEHPGTLVIVTADHATGGLALHSGEPKGHTVTAGFSSKKHDGVWVPVYAFGSGAEAFSGMYENTELFHKIREAAGF